MSTNDDLLAFLTQAVDAHARIEVDVICDNYATHKHDNIRRWLTKTRVLMSEQRSGGRDSVV